MSDSEQLIFAALSDGTRRWIIDRLSGGASLTATDLAKELTITRQGVAKHLQLLSEADLLIAEKIGRERRYRLNPSPLNDSIMWLVGIKSQWDKRLQKLYDYLIEETAAD